MSRNEKEQGVTVFLSIRARLVMIFALMACLMFLVNLLLYGEINRSMNELDQVYATNVSLNEMTECLEDIHGNVLEYLSTKSSDSLEDYYRNVQRFQDMLGTLNGAIVDNERKILEKNIKNMSEGYLELAEETIQAKRGRNVEAYKAAFGEESKNYGYIQTAIYCLNSLRFRNNSENYQILRESLSYMEMVSFLVMAAVVAFNLLILFVLIRTITEPLRRLALSADQVARGNFHIRLPDVPSRDEVGVVTDAFNKMVYSIREYIVKTKESMEKEQKMKERELLMETHLKDTQLRYLQAQINPHFLFNSLNAGAQLAVMEDAEQTSIFIEKMADFFRYNVRKSQESATLAEEIETVDNYVYILNVRFAGDIHFEKEIEAGVEEVRIPSMILQPLVENAVNHGLREADWEGHIWLNIRRREDCISVSVRDNGMGMTEERIQEVLSGWTRKDEGTDSTGIGLDNVIRRLELFYEKKNLLEIYSEGPGQGTEVRLLIPLQGAAEEGEDRQVRDPEKSPGGDYVQSSDRGR